MWGNRSICTGKSLSRGLSGVTATSADAMNAVVLAEGLSRGGFEEARRRLHMFGELFNASHQTIGRLLYA